MNQTTITDLPLLLQIFGFLGLNDLIKSKSVCKLWNELISTMRIERLFVGLNLEDKEKWFHSDWPCKASELCHPKLFFAQCKKSILSNLKYLKIKNDIFLRKYFDPNGLNQFGQLVQLELDFSCENLSLALPNLEVLLLDLGYNRPEVHLNCRRLRVLSYCEAFDEDLLRIEHPDTIRVLESQMAGAKLARFRNLECLRRTTFQFGFLDVATMLKLRNLKAFHYDHDISAFVNEGFDKIRQILTNFMRQRRASGRFSLKFYFSGLLLIDENLNDIDFCLETKNGRDFIAPESLYMNNYERLQEHLAFVEDVDYSRLFGLVDVLPEDYFRRFCNLRTVTAKCPLDEQHFLGFLKNVYCLRSLTLCGPSLSQTFFDSLPRLCSLIHLYLHDAVKENEDNRSENYENKNERDKRENDEDNEELQLNFNFIGQFERLSRLEIERNLSLESARTLICSFENLTRLFSRGRTGLSFRFRSIDYRVLRNRTEMNKPTNRYDLRASERALLQNVSLDDVLNYFIHL